MSFAHGFDLTPIQLGKLRNIKDKTITLRIKHSQLNGPHQILLNEAQTKKVMSCLKSKNKRGCDITVTGSQVGGGIVNDIANFAINDVIKPTASKLIREKVVPLLSQGVEKVADIGLKKVGLGTKQGKGLFGDIFGFGVKQPTNGTRARKARKQKPKQGKGLFGDIVRAVAKPVVNSGIDLLANGAKGVASGVLGGKVKKQIKRGKSIRLPGA